jgi:hypothetical protein
MSIADSCFKKLKHKSVYLYDICNSAVRNLENLPKEKRTNLKYYCNLQAFDIPEKFYLQEPLLEKINSQFKIKVASVCISQKQTGYPFHKDGHRNVTINMLISSGVSHSLFKIEDWVWEDREFVGEEWHFEELIFEEKTFYLYNTDLPHSVINFERDRYMFSIVFEDNKLTYKELYNWCEENDLLEIEKEG